MKVYIGPYRSWFGPYQLAELLKYVGVPEAWRDAIGDGISDSWLGSFLNWLDSKKKRKINIHIDNYDIWNADYTMALIIHPILVKLKNDHNGAPFIDNEDVPDELKAPKETNAFDTDENYFKRFEYVLDEMIWTFAQLIDDDSDKTFFANGKFDKKGYDEFNKRIENGLRLFGKYYRGLWN